MHDRDVVRDGYDRLGGRYREWSLEMDSEVRDRWLDDFERMLPERASVLDLGCGPGFVAGRLSKRFDVLGVDLSEVQIAHARHAVPNATFLVADMTTLQLPAASVDGVVALFSLIHLPSNDLPAMLERIATWLRPGGTFLATLGTIAGDGVQGDWLGVPMFFGGSTAARNRTLVEAAGLRIDRDEVATLVEPEEGEVQFHWLLATKRADRDV
jgi:SAM-dependent methyltransferase